MERGPDVARRAGQVLAEHLRAAPRRPRHGVELPPVEVRVLQGCDLPGVVEEGRRVEHLGGEPEPVRDVGQDRRRVRHVDLVEHVVAELEEVRAARRPLQRDVVRDERDGVGGVGADEGVEVGAVRHRVLGDLGCFAVRGHVSAPLERRGGPGCGPARGRGRRPHAPRSAGAPRRGRGRAGRRRRLRRTPGARGAGAARCGGGAGRGDGGDGSGPENGGGTRRRP